MSTLSHTTDGTPQPWDNLWDDCAKYYKNKKVKVRYFIIKEMKEISKDEYND